MKLQELANAGEWEVLREGAQAQLAAGHAGAAVWFFSALADLELGNFVQAAEYSDHGLEIDPASFWGMALHYDAVAKLGQVVEALARLEQFVVANPTLQALDLLVDRAAEIGDFDLALRYSPKRLELRGLNSFRKAIAVPCFAKSDTLQQLFDSLLSQDVSGWSLIVLQDSIHGSRHEQKYRDDVDAVTALIDCYFPIFRSRFNDTRLLRYDMNLGPTLACQRLLDSSFETNDYVVFLEDDCLLAPPTLSWFTFAKSLLDDDTWFVAGESVFFDSQAQDLDESVMDKLIDCSRSEKVASKYIFENFVPSSCFALTKKVWEECGAIRGLPRGDINLTSFLRRNEKRTVFPAVPFVRDIGMLHRNGYSVLLHGEAGVRERKNSYIIPASFSPSKASELSVDRNLLYAATKHMDRAALELLWETVR